MTDQTTAAHCEQSIVTPAVAAGTVHTAGSLTGCFRVREQTLPTASSVQPKLKLSWPVSAHAADARLLLSMILISKLPCLSAARPAQSALAAPAALRSAASATHFDTCQLATVPAAAIQSEHGLHVPDRLPHAVSAQHLLASVHALQHRCHTDNEDTKLPLQTRARSTSAEHVRARKHTCCIKLFTAFSNSRQGVNSKPMPRCGLKTAT